MATYAVGDIHGNSAALRDLLAQLRSELTADDVLVFLGDYIDRGPDSKGCVNALIAFRDEVAAEVVFLAGNHEDWFLNTLHDYRRHSWILAMDAWDTIRSYSADAERVLRMAMKAAKTDVYLERGVLPYEVFFDALPAAHIQFFEQLRTHHQSADCVCAHGGVDARTRDVRAQTRHNFLWGGGGFPEQYDAPETVVYGHFNNAALDEEGWPGAVVHGRTIGIDTIAHGVLTAIRLPDRRLFQSARYRFDAAEV